jgi:DNA-binding NarL/FixJ family response regulator
MSAIRVLIADDQALIRHGIRQVLESDAEITVVAEAENGRQVLAVAQAQPVDVAVIDIQMPLLDGLSAVEQLHRISPAVRAVVLTSFGEQANVLRAIEHAAAGFVLKNCTPAELIGAVHAAHRGEAYLSPAITKMLLGMLTPVGAQRRNEARQRLGVLTERETGVLRLIAEGLSNADIGLRLHMSEPTIKTYVSRILGKLELTNRVQAAMLVRDADG